MVQARKIAKQSSVSGRDKGNNRGATIPMITFSTSTDRTIFVEAIYIQPTYLGIGVGQPNRATNREVAQSILSKVGKIWPDMPVALVGQIDVDVLPEYCVAAKTFATQPVADLSMDASHLILVFFIEVAPCEGVFTQKMLQEFSWEAHACDFCW